MYRKFALSLPLSIPAAKCLLLFLVLLISPRISAQHGDLDPTFQTGTGVDGTVRSLLALAGGKTLVAGDFSSYNGTVCNGLIVLNPDGTLDSTFNPGTGTNGTIHQAVPAGSGRILIVGSFTSYAGTARNNLVMINSNGSISSGFRSGAGTDGPILAIARTDYDEWAIGGDFSSFDGQPRENFAKFDSSGYLDSFVRPSFNGTIRHIGNQNDGYSPNLVLSGDFTEIDSRPFPGGVAVLDRYGYTNYYDLPPVTSGSVRASAYVRSDFGFQSASLLLGGDFRTQPGNTRHYLRAFDDRGSPDPTFNIFPNGAVDHILPGGSGDQMIIAGAFTEVNGIPMKGIARIYYETDYSSPLGYREQWVLDQSFGGPSGPDESVFAVLEDSQGRYVIGGNFENAGGVPQGGIARLLSRFGLELPAIPSGLAAEAVSAKAIRLTWANASNTANYRLERSPDGIGDWTEIRTTSSTSYISTDLETETEYHFRVKSENGNGSSGYSVVTAASTPGIWTGPGSLVPGTAGIAFASSTINDTAVQPDGKILFAGFFTQALGFERKYVARLNPDRTLDMGFDTGNLLTSSAKLTAVAPDGKIYVVSDNFSSALGFGDMEILRLNQDGTHDPTFTPPDSSFDIQCIDIDPLGNVLLGLNTTTFGGQSTGTLVRLKTDGTIDPAFSINANSTVRAIDFHPDRRIVAAGSFSIVNGTTTRSILRADSAGNIDPTIGNGSSIFSINAVDARPDGSILIAGSFTSFLGETRSRIARLNPDGTLDSTFVPPEIDSTVSEIECLPGGKILVAGSFTKIDGNYIPRIARLLSTGETDDGFRTGLGASSTINSISMAMDGSLIVAGGFSTFDGEETRNIAFLKGDEIGSLPLAPGLSPGEVGTGHLDLSWAGQDSAFGYFLETSGNGTDGWTRVAWFSRDSASFRIAELPPGVTRFFRLIAMNGLGVSAYSDTVSARTWTRFQGWNVDHGFPFDTPAASDSDNDGMGQLMEYGLGLDPDENDSEGAISMQLIGGNLVLTYYRTKAELTYKVQVSDNLTDWTTEGVSEYHGKFSMGWAPVVEPTRFLRLSISE